MNAAALLPVAQLDQSFFRDRSDPSCAQENGIFCFEWAVDNIDRYVAPTLEHLFLVGVSVALGFLIAFSLALLSHRRRWLQPPLIAGTGVLYTLPSLAFFFLLLPITGRGKDTAIIALTAYTLQIIFRNTVTGLNGVPTGVKDSARGMGLTDRQMLWRVELPLAMPEIIAGLRIATVSTVAIATLAVFAGAGGLGEPLYQQIDFKTNIIIAGGIAIVMAVLFDLLLLLFKRMRTPWLRGAAT